MPYLVLLGHDRNGLSTFQRVSSPISQELGANRANANQDRLSQLRHHVDSRRTWILNRILHGRYQVYRPQVYDRDVQFTNGHPSLSLHRLVGPQLSAGNDLFGGLYAEHHVWGSICLVCSSRSLFPGVFPRFVVKLFNRLKLGGGYEAKRFRSPQVVLPKCFRPRTEELAPASRRV